jgi:hypothetical protein
MNLVTCHNCGNSRAMATPTLCFQCGLSDRKQKLINALELGASQGDLLDQLLEVERELTYSRLEL